MIGMGSDNRGASVLKVRKGSELAEEMGTTEDEVLSREIEDDEDDEDDDDDLQCDKYDGMTPVEEFLTHFWACRDVNGWDEEEKLARLITSLEGNAAQVMLARKDWTFDSLCVKLQEVFGDERFTLQFQVE